MKELIIDMKLAVTVSDKFYKELMKDTVKPILNNCFRNNDRTLLSISIDNIDLSSKPSGMSVKTFSKAYNKFLQNRKLAAVRILREEYFDSLKEAKEFVDFNFKNPNNENN